MNLICASNMIHILNKMKCVGYLRFKDTGKYKWIIICVQTDYKIYYYEQEGIIEERIENISKNTQWDFWQR